MCRPQWPRGLRRRSAAVRLLISWVRIPPKAWMFVCCECCVLPGRGFCDGLITRPEESYRLWCVVVCDLEKPQEWGGHCPRLGCKRHKKKIVGIWLNILISSPSVTLKATTITTATFYNPSYEQTCLLKLILSYSKVNQWRLESSTFLTWIISAKK